VFEIGASLREARLRQGLDLRDAETATKIRTKYLRALEEERFDQLPAETYIRGFLRTYAEHLGLDGQLYVDEYNSRYAVDEDQIQQLRARPSAPRASRRRRNRDSGMVLAALLAIALVTALVIAAWRFGGGDGGDAGIPGLDRATTGAETTPAAPPAPATPARTRVVLRAVANSFVEVRANGQRGRQLYSGTLEQGQSRLFQARRVWLNIGIPQNVRVTVNGRRVQLLERRGPTIYLATSTGLAPASPTT
jgi:cytoskeleton protein RodZ